MLRILTFVTLIATSVSVTAESVDSINRGTSIELSNFDCADESADMIEWLGRGKNYRDFVVADVEKELYKQRPQSQLIRLECISEPELLTGAGALTQDRNDSKAVVTRFSVTFPLKATVRLSGSIWVLTVDQNYYAENLDLPKNRKLLIQSSNTQHRIMGNA